MKKILLLIPIIAATVLSCATQDDPGSGALKAEALAAYMQKYHPDAVKTALGAYIYQNDEIPGTGSELGSEAYVRMHYTITDRNGSFRSTTVDTLAKKNNIYSEFNYYGPVVRYRGNNSLTAGLEQVLSGEGTPLGPMKMGGTRKALIPGWLFSMDTHKTEAGYYDNESGSEAVYTISLVEAFDDEEAWEKDSLARYIQANMPEAVEDTLVAGIASKGGWYYAVTKAVEDTAPLASDSTVYCNYILRDLAGRIIDTNIEKVARDYDLYTSSATYSPQKINWNSDYTKITMSTSESDVVDGFANAFLHMHQFESGSAVFWSYLGYYATGSGNKVPAYCPLRFDIELVQKPD